MNTFLDFHGLSTFFDQLKNLFATKSSVNEVKVNTDPFILDIDYSELEFNKELIISGTASQSSAMLGSAVLGQMVLGQE